MEWHQGGKAVADADIIWRVAKRSIACQTTGVAEITTGAGIQTIEGMANKVCNLCGDDAVGEACGIMREIVGSNDLVATRWTNIKLMMNGVKGKTKKGTELYQSSEVLFK